MRQRLPLWFLTLALLAAGAIWFWKSHQPHSSESSIEKRDTSRSVLKATQLPNGQTEPMAMLSRPATVDFTEALAKAYAKQNRSRLPNRLSNASMPLKQ